MLEEVIPGMGSEPPEDITCPHGVCSMQVTTVAWNYNVKDVNISSMENGTISNTSVIFGKQLLSQEAQGGLIVLYSLTVLFSIIGNFLVVIVFTKGRRSKTDIRPFLINLAIADLIMALSCMPFTFTFVMIRNWIFSKPMCPIVLFMQHLSVSASIFTNMAIGIDRFLVVTFPLRARMTNQRAKYTICIIWVCSVGLSSVQLVVGRAIDVGTFVDCDEQWENPGDRRTFTMFVLFITYIIPLVILSVTYSVVSILLWRRTAPGNAHEDRDSQQLRAKRKVIKMLVLVVIMFGVCWLPLHTFFLVLDFNPQIMLNRTEAQERVFTFIYYTAFWMAMSNSCANPIIYGFTNDSFKIDMASLCYLWFPFCQCLKKVANRRLSVSTCDSGLNKRFSTLKKNPTNSLYRQSAYRNCNRVYIELRRDMSRGRSLASMNDFYRESLEQEKKGIYFHGRPVLCNSHNIRHHKHHCHHSHSHRHHAPLFRSERSGDCAVPLASFNFRDMDRSDISPFSAKSEDRNGGPLSPCSLMPDDFSFTKMEDSSSSYRLSTLAELDNNEISVDFNTV